MPTEVSVTGMKKRALDVKSKNINFEGKRATSYDVARVAGVSQSAVSRCFKPGASVSAKTRAKVENAAKALGYTVNAIARGLISGRSNIVGVLITQLTNLNYPQILSELNRKFDEKDIHILLFTLDKESDVDKVLEKVWQYQVDGIIAAAQFTNTQISACQDRNIPLVFYNRLYPQNTVSSVCCDHYEGERALVEGLLNNGRKSFVVMSGPVDSSVSTARTKGAVAQLKGLPVDMVELEGDYSYERACSLTRSVMDSANPKPDAFVCTNDIMALGCLDTLRIEYKAKIPKDISVVGFDGVDAAAWLNYDLTTVLQPLERMVEAAVDMLMERIEVPELPAEKRLFAGSIRHGATAQLD
jgi:DNA-binding LacI/PurR family transcriptional regulator|tara:strand:+ start:2352 stop:3422 length:1071 start_codon:yes stop_codon:yes gene_type:complete